MTCSGGTRFEKLQGQAGFGFGTKATPRHRLVFEFSAMPRLFRRGHIGNARREKRCLSPAVPKGGSKVDRSSSNVTKACFAQKSALALPATSHCSRVSAALLGSRWDFGDCNKSWGTTHNLGCNSGPNICVRPGCPNKGVKPCNHKGAYMTDYRATVNKHVNSDRRTKSHNAAKVSARRVLWKGPGEGPLARFTIVPSGRPWTTARALRRMLGRSVGEALPSVKGSAEAITCKGSTV